MLVLDDELHIFVRNDTLNAAIVDLVQICLPLQLINRR